VSTPAKSARVPAAEARARILAATRRLLLEQPFATLTVEAVMSEAGLARTIFYRHYTDLPQLAPDLLPDVEDPIIDRIERTERDDPEAVVHQMIAALVDVYAQHGRLLQAIDDAARHDRAVAERLDTALVGPRQIIARLLRSAKHPPPDPEESAHLLMATHRAYLLDTFGHGHPRRGAKQAATAALSALWERLRG
jgi:TetR/AcrR family transcriptional regulator, ethionamide resistance regulator